MKNMGNLKTVCRGGTEKNYQQLPPIEDKNYEIIKTIWKTVEKDSVYYGFAICTTFFKNYPKYAKYFEDEAIPEFVREAKVKKKFSTICDIISALFINYNVKPSQRNYLLGYIAMIHKDMGLTMQDLENFISCIVEALCAELPQLMTSEYVMVQMKCFNILSEALLLLMEKHSTQIDQMSRSEARDNKICGSCFGKEPVMIYNYPLKYWLYKKRSWEYRRAVWASLEMGPAMGTAAVTDPGKIKMQSRRRTIEIRRANQRRRRSKATRKQSSSDSDRVEEHKKPESRKPGGDSWLLTNLRKKKKKLNANTTSKLHPMKTIHEVQHDKTLRYMNGDKEYDSAINIQQNYQPTLPMPVNPQSSRHMPASSNKNAAARERKRQHNNLMSLIGYTYTT